MRIFPHFQSENQTTTNYCCRFCSFKIHFRHSVFFDLTVIPLSRFLLLTHSLIRHWGIYDLKENLHRIRSALLYLLLIFPMLLLDLLHGVLWLLTLPFWWIHEQL